MKCITLFLGMACCCMSLGCRKTPEPADTSAKQEQSPRGLPRPELAPADQNFVDSTRGRKWGDRCYLHIKAQRYEWAVAACQKGLAADPEKWTHGALLYNLGLIGERTGNLEAARHYYSESLRVRPTGRSADIVRRELHALSE